MRIPARGGTRAALTGPNITSGLATSATASRPANSGSRKICGASRPPTSMRVPEEGRMNGASPGMSSPPIRGSLDCAPLAGSYRDVHEINLGQWNGGVPYVLVAEQEQACDPARPESKPPGPPGHALPDHHVSMESRQAARVGTGEPARRTRRFYPGAADFDGGCQPRCLRRLAGRASAGHFLPPVSTAAPRDADTAQCQDVPQRIPDGRAHAVRHDLNTASTWSILPLSIWNSSEISRVSGARTGEGTVWPFVRCSSFNRPVWSKKAKDITRPRSRSTTGKRRSRIEVTNGKKPLFC